jgi:hypothetical protein
VGRGAGALARAGGGPPRAIDAWDIFEKTPIASRTSAARVRPAPRGVLLAAPPWTGRCPPRAARGVRGPRAGGEDDAAERVAHQPELTTSGTGRSCKRRLRPDQDLVAAHPTAASARTASAGWTWRTVWASSSPWARARNCAGGGWRGGGAGRLPTHESPRRAHTALVRFEGDMPRPAFVRLVGCDVRRPLPLGRRWICARRARGGRARVVWWAAMVPCATSSVSVRLEEEA